MKDLQPEPWATGEEFSSYLQELLLSVIIVYLELNGYLFCFSIKDLFSFTEGLLS